MLAIIDMLLLSSVSNVIGRISSLDTSYTNLDTKYGVNGFCSMPIFQACSPFCELMNHQLMIRGIRSVLETNISRWPFNVGGQLPLHINILHQHSPSRLFHFLIQESSCHFLHFPPKYSISLPNLDMVTLELMSQQEECHLQYDKLDLQN